MIPAIIPFHVCLTVAAIIGFLIFLSLMSFIDNGHRQRQKYLNILKMRLLILVPLLLASLVNFFCVLTNWPYAITYAGTPIMDGRVAAVVDGDKTFNLNTICKRQFDPDEMVELHKAHDEYLVYFDLWIESSSYKIKVTDIEGNMVTYFPSHSDMN